MNDTATLTEAEEPVDVAQATMLGDLTAIVIDELKAAPQGYAHMSRDDQQCVIDRVHGKLRRAVSRVVDIVGAEDRPSVVAKVDSITIKDPTKVVLKIDASDTIDELWHQHGRDVLLVLGGPKEHFMGGSPPEPDPAQGELTIDAVAGALGGEPLSGPIECADEDLDEAA